jgi:16S rRNA (uracil1498-N3)-methyltransferase
VRPRFHVPGVDAAALRIDLPEDEAEHLVRVLRLGVGDEVDVFDGRGGLWRAEVVHASKKSAAVRALEPLQPARELRVPVTLVMSVLKGDKMDDVVRDAVMLGVTAIRPVISERAETGMAVMARSNRIARWQRIAVSSAKQCARAVVPPVHQAMSLESYWRERTEPLTSRVMCVEPAAAAGAVVSVTDVPKAGGVHVVVGPEGGWSVTEISAAEETGAILMSLGSRTLRADAVPIVALTALLTTWGELI